MVVAHEVLAHAEAVAVHEADADQEGRGAGAAGEAGRLGVEEDGAAQVESLELRLARSARATVSGVERVAARLSGTSPWQVSRWHVGLDQEELAALVLDAQPCDQLFERARRAAPRRRARCAATATSRSQPLP